MDVTDPESDEAVTERVKRLRKALGYDTSVAFALFLGVSPQRWNNPEIGLPLSKDLALKLVRKVHGLSLDWVLRGRAEGLPIELARRLGELPQAPGRKATTR